MPWARIAAWMTAVLILPGGTLLIPLLAMQLVRKWKQIQADRDTRRESTTPLSGAGLPVVESLEPDSVASAVATTASALVVSTREPTAKHLT